MEIYDLNLYYFKSLIYICNTIAAYQFCFGAVHFCMNFLYLRVCLRNLKHFFQQKSFLNNQVIYLFIN